MDIIEKENYKVVGVWLPILRRAEDTGDAEHSSVICASLFRVTSSRCRSTQKTVRNVSKSRARAHTHTHHLRVLPGVRRLHFLLFARSSSSIRCCSPFDGAHSERGRSRLRPYIYLKAHWKLLCVSCVRRALFGHAKCGDPAKR